LTLSTHVSEAVRGTIVALAVLAITMLPADAADQPISSEGRWHVDFDRSDVPYGPRPNSVMLDVVRDDEQAYEATETVVQPDGKIRTEQIKAEYDGKPHAVEGSPDHITISMTRLAEDRRYIKLDTPNGFHAAMLCSFSDDLKVMTCDTMFTDPQGRITPAKSVYVRDAPGQPRR
jgi:hypothetical protein